MKMMRWKQRYKKLTEPILFYGSGIKKNSNTRKKNSIKLFTYRIVIFVLLNQRSCEKVALISTYKEKLPEISFSGINYKCDTKSKI